MAGIPNNNIVDSALSASRAYVLRLTPPLLPGHRVGKHDIERIISADESGISYMGVDRASGEAVVIREFLPAQLARRNSVGDVFPKGRTTQAVFAEALERFIAESKRLCELTHPHLVRGRCVGEERGTAYLITEYVHGQRLSEAIRLMRLAGEQQLCDLVDAVCGGLAAMHTHGLVHGGVQPEHIFLRAPDACVLLDLACSRYTAMQFHDPHIHGVPKSYLPIEMVRSDARGGKSLGPWTDIYGLGATLYRAITGESPIPALTRATQRAAGGDDPLKSVLAVRAGLYSRRFLAAIDIALALEPESRPRSIAQWRESLVQDVVGDDESISVNAAPSAGPEGELASKDPVPTSGKVDAVFLDAFHQRLEAGSPSHLTRAITVKRPHSLIMGWALAAGCALAVTVAGVLWPQNSDPLAIPVSVEAVAAVAQVNKSPSMDESTPAPVLAAAKEQPGSEAMVPESLTSNEVKSNIAQSNNSGQIATISDANNPTALAALAVLTAVAHSSAETSDNLLEPRMVDDGLKPFVAAANPQAAVAPLPIPPEVAKEIAALLKAAKADVAAHRLTSPKGNNAHERYQRVLELDALNAAAKDGLEAIVSTYVSWAERAARRGDRIRTKRMLQRASVVWPDHEKLVQVRAKLLPN